MLLFLCVLIIAVITIIFISLYDYIGSVEETLLQIQKKVGSNSCDVQRELYGYVDPEVVKSCIRNGAWVPGSGIFSLFQELVIKRDEKFINQFQDKIAEILKYLNVEYIDERKVINGKEEVLFQGYRKVKAK